MKQEKAPGMKYNYSAQEITDNKARVFQILEKMARLYPTDYSGIPAHIKELFGSVGENPWINPYFMCDAGSGIHAGNNFFANNNVTIQDIGGVYIGDDVRIGPFTLITTVNHPLNAEERKGTYAYCSPVHIGNNVWIGGSCTILPGVTIGDNAVIGAGSVVTKDVPANTLVCGVPAKPVRKLD